MDVTTPEIVDVLVVGGGTAGAMAGIAAARAGAKTLVVEQQGFLGGSATGALVTPLMANRVGGVNLNRGLTDELKQRLHALGGGGATPGNDGWFDPEAMKLALEEMACASGVRLLYYTTFVAAEIEEEPAKAAEAPGSVGAVRSGRKRLTGVRVYGKSRGLRLILAQVIIDATGDAEVAVSAGAPWEGGRRGDGAHQALSVRFIMGGVDNARLADFLAEIDGEPQLPSCLHAAMVWGKGWSRSFAAPLLTGFCGKRTATTFSFSQCPGGLESWRSTARGSMAPRTVPAKWN